VDIVLEEGDEREFLFVAQILCDAGGLGSIRVDLDDLHGDVLAVRGLASPVWHLPHQSHHCGCGASLSDAQW
jgi:hypothetical protein